MRCGIEGDSQSASAGALRAATGEEYAMGDVIGYLVVGVIAGWLAGVITKTNRGIIGDLILGILGALLFGFIFNSINDNFILEIIGATAGAVILVVIKNLVMSRRG